MSVQAKNVPDKPNPPKLVNDFAGMLTEPERIQLEQKLLNFSNKTGNQIAIVTEKSLNDEAEIVDYANELSIKWQIGQKDRRNGVLIYVAIDDKQTAITVGYGLEPAISDAQSTQIRKEVLGAYLKQGQNFAAFDAASSELMALASKEFAENNQAIKQTNNKKPKNSWLILVIIIIIVVIARFSKKNGGKGGRGGGILGPGGMFLPMGGFGGGFGGRGSGGGGFGGFGGGDFGGGGSGGSW
ncbi:MAG: TPM domain-containing protein [Bacteroidota bacterium]|nr:TPM domain-containing protein [Bacteroidota bacterium]